MEAKESQSPTEGPDQLDGGDFITDGVQVKLILTNDGVSWKTFKDKKSVDLEWRDVIRCHRGAVSSRKPTVVPEGVEKEPCFTVHYIEKQKNYVWKHKYKTFQSTKIDFEPMLTTMCDKCKMNRPGRLMVLINPVGGTGRGEAQYERIVAPLFKLAQIDTDITVSQHPKHVEEIGESHDFSSVDGVVVVGGDGTLQQLIETWFPRLQRQAGTDINDPKAKLIPFPCPIGMIPTGSANGLARLSYGCSDVATAALNIISGRTVRKNVLSLSNSGKHVCVAGVCIMNGTWSDILDSAIQSRRLGWFRYPITAITAFVRTRREFNIQLEYLPCQTSLTTDETSTGRQTSDTGWIPVEGHHTGVYALPGLYSPNEASEKFKIDSTSEGMTMILEKQCGKLKYFRWAFKFGTFHNDMFNEDFVTIKGVKAYRYRVVQNEGENKTEREHYLEKVMNVDGEPHVLEDPDILVRNHRNMIVSYGTNPMFSE